MSKLKQHLERGNSSQILSERSDIIRRSKDRNFYGFTFDQANGRHPLSLALDFLTKNGNRFGIYYMEISSPLHFNLGSNGQGQTITLKTGKSEISIEGKNLFPIYEYILEQRLVWIKEVDSSFTEDSENEPIVEAIRFSAKD